MRVSRFHAMVVCAVVGAVLVACAVGTDTDPQLTELEALPVEAGEDGATRLPVAVPDRDSGTSALDSSSVADASADGAPDAAVGRGDAGSPCDSPAPCTGATDLGSVSGDTGSGVKTARGSSAQWLKIRVTEDDSSIVGVPLKVKVDLTSPAGTNFDLFVYMSSGPGVVECSSVAKSSTSTGMDTASLDWGEGLLPNGVSDEREVTVEVRWVSGTCNPSAMWSLTVSGNR